LDAFGRETDQGRLRRDVWRLAEPRGRDHAPAGMASAEAYVTAELERAGWQVRRRPFGGPVPGVNLVADRGARGDGGPAPVFLVGAHLDTVPASPGADDNASGVACLLELARLLPPAVASQVRLAVFDREETGLHGSRALAAELVAAERPAAVVVFECVGYRAGRPGSQTLPRGASLIFPRQHRRARRRGWRGDWTLIAYQRSSLRLARLLGDHLAHLAGADAVMFARDPLDLRLAGPLLRRYVPLIVHFARSDHKPFWDLGVPAIQVTDTANFRNPHYHLPSDLPETLDYERLAEIVAATAATLAAVVAEGGSSGRGPTTLLS
jgi:Zn-dependent M28 family amino/carboxypeptidase